MKHNVHCTLLYQTMTLSFQTEPELHFHTVLQKKNHLLIVCWTATGCCCPFQIRVMCVCICLCV